MASKDILLAREVLQKESPRLKANIKQQSRPNTADLSEKEDKSHINVSFRIPPVWNGFLWIFPIEKR